MSLGLALGMAASWAFSRVGSPRSFGVQPTDPAALAFAISGDVCCSALLACLIPALHASRVNPSEALRGE